MSPDLEALLGPRRLRASQAGAGKVPFIASISPAARTSTVRRSSSARTATRLNFLSTAGYAKLGLPGNMTPGSANAASPH